MASSTTDDNAMLNQIVEQGDNIYGSREKIRNALIQYAKKYLNLGDADIRKTSYLAYLIDQISILSANQIFYDNTIYREFFFTDAQLSESVYNLAKWIGYTVPKAVPATVEVMFSIPLNFSKNYINFNLSPFFSVRSGDIPFIIKSDSLDASTAASFVSDTTEIGNLEVQTQGRVINNSMLSIKDSDGYYRPTFLSADNKTAFFTLTFVQKELVMKIFQVPSDLSNNQFYSIPIEYEGQVSDIEVFVISPSYNQTLELSGTNLDGVVTADSFNPAEEIYDSVGAVCTWVKWKEATNGIYTMSSSANQYNWIGGYNKGELLFGNGILGKQPQGGSLVAVRLHVTKGSTGNVIANTINVGDTIYSDTSDGTTATISYTIRNPKCASGGEDLLTLPEIKNNAITNLSAKNRLVSENDYDNIETIVSDTPLHNCYPILKRSDLKSNEIMAFSTLTYDNNSVNGIVPTRNISINVTDPTFDSSNQYAITRNTEYIVGDNTYITLFNLTMNEDNLTTNYDYILQNIEGSTTQMYSKASESFYDQFTYLTSNGSNFNINMETKSIIGESYPLQVQFNVNHIASSYSDLDSNLQTTLIANNMLNSDDLSSNDDNWTSEFIQYFKVTHFQAKMTTKWDSYQVYDTSSSSGYSYETIYDKENKSITYKNFSWRIDNYLSVPEGMQRFEFLTQCYAPVRDSENYIIGVDGSRVARKDGKLISGKSGIKVKFAWQNLSTYYSDIIVRRNLDNYMMSSVSKTNTNVVTFINDSNEAVSYTKEEALDMIDKSNSGYFTIVKNTKTVELARTLATKTEDTTIIDALSNMNYGETLKITRVNAYNLVEEGMEDGNNYDYTIHNVPVILKSYYDQVLETDSDSSSTSNFETNVMQKLISTLTFNSHRMLTDFINVKLADTYGPMINLKYNKPSYYVESRYDHTPWWDSTTQDVPKIIVNENYVVPTASQDLVYYIVNGTIDTIKTPLNEYIGYIASRNVTPITNAEGETEYTYTYTLLEPTVGMFVKVKDELDDEGYLKTLVWNGRIWKDIDEYNIPLEIKLKIEVDSSVVSKSDSTITQEIIDALTEYFESKIGLQCNIDRSEIIKVCRSISGVVYAELQSPEFDIRFDYDIDDLTQQQLLDFTPQYIGFRGKDSNETDYSKSSINVNIVRV